VKLHLTISFFVLKCGCHIAFEIWISILKRRDFLEVIAINGRMILKFYFEGVVWKMWTAFLWALDGDQ